MSLLIAIAEFVLKLFTGDVWAAWHRHKENEARNDEAKIDSLSDKQLDQQFDSDLVRPKD